MPKLNPTIDWKDKKTPEASLVLKKICDLSQSWWETNPGPPLKGQVYHLQGHKFMVEDYDHWTYLGYWPSFWQKVKKLLGI